MIKNAFRMAKTSAKLIIRNKAFLVIGILIPFFATMLMQLWYRMPSTTQTDQYTNLADMDEQIAYHIDFNCLPVKFYDTVGDASSEKFCKALGEAGLFQIFRTDCSSATEEQIRASYEKTALEDRVGAIVVYRENKEECQLFSVGQDERFSHFETCFNQLLSIPEAVERVIANASAAGRSSDMVLVSVENNDSIEFDQVREFSYCLAIASLAFIFGGVMILNTVMTEKKDNVYSRILLSRASKRSYLLSKLILSFGLTLLQTIVMTISFVFVISVKLNVTTLQFFVIFFLQGLIFNLLSLAAGLFYNSMAASSVIAFTMWSISALISGTYFDISGASDLFQKLSLLMPQRWAMFSVSRFINGNLSGYSLIFCATAAYLVIIFVLGLLGMKLSEEE